MVRVEKITKAEYEIKKSKFISYITPISEFKVLQNRLRQEHPKARHIVWAYRELNEFDQVVENSTDDGEPKGAAGVPTLNVLRGNDLINSAILTVRYFGGIKLGVGGMVRAYTNSAKEVVLKAKFISYEKRQKVEFKTPYHVVQKYEYFFEKLKIDYQDRIFEVDGVKWKVFLTNSELLEYKKFIQR